MSNSITATEFKLVDASGNVRAVLGTTDEGSALSFFNSKGKLQLKMMVDEAGLSFLKMYNNTDQENAKVDISLDDKGTHLLLAGEDRQESYLFLKNDGSTGVVLKNKNGERRAQVLLTSTDVPDVSIYPDKDTNIKLK